jgi:hypothetical protein
MSRLWALGSLAVFLLAGAAGAAMAAVDGADEAGGTGFIQRHWWDFLVVFFLVSMIFAYSDEDRNIQAAFWSVVTLLYLLYICLFRNSAIYS